MVYGEGGSPDETLKLGGDMSQWVRDGKVKHREFVTEGLDSAPGAFIGLLKGANFGKQLVRVGPDKA